MKTESKCNLAVVVKVAVTIFAMAIKKNATPALTNVEVMRSAGLATVIKCIQEAEVRSPKTQVPRRRVPRGKERFRVISQTATAAKHQQHNRKWTGNGDPTPTLCTSILHPFLIFCFLGSCP